MRIARYDLAFSTLSLAQAHWYWLPRVERFERPVRGYELRWLCGLWYAFEG